MNNNDCKHIFAPPYKVVKEESTNLGYGLPKWYKYIWIQECEECGLARVVKDE